MKHSVAHDLGFEQAKRATEAAWKSYAGRFGKYTPTMAWDSESQANIGFTAKGLHLRGSIWVLPASIDLDLDVPFLLRPFKSMALGVIEDEIQRWIQKSKSGQV